MHAKWGTGLSFTLIGLAGLLMTACSSDAPVPEEEPKLDVVAAFYPLEFLADRVGDDAVNVIPLTTGGVAASEMELTPEQVAEITDAAVVLYVKGFQPAVDAAIAQNAPETSIDLGAGLETQTQTNKDGQTVPDPHVWLNPLNMIRMADVVRTRLTTLSPGQASDFETNHDRLDRHLESLDTNWEEGTTTCESRKLVVSHEAFAYLAQRYGFEQIGIPDLSPDAEPNPIQTAELAALAQTTAATTIYSETAVDPQVAVTIAEEAGVTTETLDPLESRSQDESGDYLSVMLQNLDAVKEGQRCT